MGHFRGTEVGKSNFLQVIESKMLFVIFKIQHSKKYLTKFKCFSFFLQCMSSKIIM